LLLWFLAWRELKRRNLLAGIRPTLKPHTLPGAWKFAVNVNLTGSLNVALGPVARLIVGGLLGPVSAGLYRVAGSLADSANKPADLLAKVYYPEVVRMDLATRTPWNFMIRGTVLALLVGVAAAMLVVAAGKPLLAALFGAEFVPAYPILLILIIAPLIGMLSFPLPPMLYALDRPGAPLRAKLYGTIAYFLVVAPLCWRFGVIGAAAAFVIGNGVMVAALMLQVRREYRRVRKA
jgi:O-antigen/teichoic acid export membrane protein